MPQQWRASERGILFAMDGEPYRVSPRIEAEFKEVRREGAGPLAAAMNLPETHAVLTRLGTGRRCFAAWIEGKIAAYGWVSRTAECIGEQEREIHMLPHEAYIWDCATRPEYRGRRLYSALLVHIVAVLREEGVRCVWIGTALTNEPSLRGFVNAGFRPVLTLSYARFFNLYVVLEAAHPAAGHALVAAARRAVTMNYEWAWGPLVLGRSRPTLLPTCAEMEA